MRLAELLLLVSAAALFYTWLGYGLCLCLLTTLRRIPIRKAAYLPSVSIIIAARNEAGSIAERLQNLLQLDYPAERLEIIVASDGSTDGTAEIVRRFAFCGVKLLDFKHSRGRAAVHNAAAAVSCAEILIFTDADTRFRADFVRQVAGSFADPRVGCVSGSIVFSGRGACAVLPQKTFYWRYEYWLRRLESAAGILACASGPSMAVRRELFRPLAGPAYDVDFITPLDVIEQGRLVIHDPEAVCSDQFFSTPRQELKAQIRMVARNLAGYGHRHSLLHSARTWPQAWGLLSHKLLRWLTPFFLLAALGSNAVLALQGRATFLLLVQLAFYGLALLGSYRGRNLRPAALFRAPFAFCLANIGFFVGVLYTLRARKLAVYSK